MNMNSHRAQLPLDDDTFSIYTLVIGGEEEHNW